jgi:hypothetical protein
MTAGSRPDQPTRARLASAWKPRRLVLVLAACVTSPRSCYRAYRRTRQREGWTSPPLEGIPGEPRRGEDESIN